ncbi:hypothetical protein Ddye_009179 [Dipteronia dyeriana]|uniref:AIPP2-like SPOC-like domain-containing protein n=1 Tax=Dipteronia dyeriana TaxID=168575 RepID=A0AAE0CM09_9ROSI|nr:hypothetical protein Ddye_009179 [Dipteronia dyeriana]
MLATVWTYCQKNEKENVVWTCEECGAKETKLGPVSSRKSYRISHAAEVRSTRKQIRKQISFPCDKAHVQMDIFPVQANQSRGDDCLLSNEDSKKLPAIVATFDNDQEISATFGNQGLRKQRGGCSWTMGSFNINCVKCLMQYRDFELVAHLTRRGCPRVCDAVTSLPLLLTVEILSKSDAWPQRFQISPRSYDSIVLYFFPVYESDEKVFDALLDDMIDHDLALKAVVNDSSQDSHDHK